MQTSNLIRDFILKVLIILLFISPSLSFAQDGFVRVECYSHSEMQSYNSDKTLKAYSEVVIKGDTALVKVIRMVYIDTSKELLYNWFVSQTEGCLMFVEKEAKTS